MSFNDYLKNAWNEHAKDAAKVADGFSDGLKLVETADHVGPMASLITHVTGEHLGQWRRGIEWLDLLKSNPVVNSDSEASGAIQRSIAALELASGNDISVNSFTPSERIRILAVAASALASSQTPRAISLLQNAMKLAETSPLDQKDPAHRALAVTGNNLASALEEKKSRTHGETELMILSAQTARRHWAIAGGWLETERAEYRLANSYLKAGQHELAMKHAKLCLEISKANTADELELFFANEAIANVALEQGQNAAGSAAVLEMKSLYTRMSSDNQPWCKEVLEKLLARV